MQSVYLIGIGGTGMASLAGMLQQSGYRVSGSDAGVYPPMSTVLEQMGITVHNGYDAAHLDPAPNLVVVGNALSRGNPEVEAVLDRGLRYESMARVVKDLFLRGREVLVVAGTHGKTTTSSMLAWILETAGLCPGFLIGGVPGNFSAGFRLPAGEGGLFVIEGDEYDTAFFDKGPKFLHYLPRSIILTSVEYDHADIYPDLEAVKLAFRRLVNLAPGKGAIVAYGEGPAVRECVSKALCPVENYGLGEGLPWRIARIEQAGEQMHFEIHCRGELFLRAEMNLAGEHNALNALAAVALASRYGVTANQAGEALRTFRTVKRRLEIIGEAAGVIVVDDFAHHPTAIRETIRAARSRFPGRRLWAVLEPRSNTLRRRIFEKELGEVLSLADHAAIAGVFKSSNIPEQERLDPERLAQRIGARYFATAGEIVAGIAPELTRGDVVLIMSNGGFDGIHGQLLKKLGS